MTLFVRWHTWPKSWRLILILICFTQASRTSTQWSSTVLLVCSLEICSPADSTDSLKASAWHWDGSTRASGELQAQYKASFSIFFFRLLIMRSQWDLRSLSDDMFSCSYRPANKQNPCFLCNISLLLLMCQEFSSEFGVIRSCAPILEEHQISFHTQKIKHFWHLQTFWTFSLLRKPISNSVVTLAIFFFLPGLCDETFLDQASLFLITNNKNSIISEEEPNMIFFYTSQVSFFVILSIKLMK